MIKKAMLRLSCVAVGSLFFFGSGFADPPFSGTIFVDPDIITEADPSTFIEIEPIGEGVRQVFDRRINQWVNLNLHLFQLRFEDGIVVEARVNQEFGLLTAATLAEKYGGVVGRIPAVLKTDVESLTIHDGVQLFGGGNRNLLIHHGQGLLYEASSILEEVFVHEASHTSLDAEHAQAAEWVAAQVSDGEFISDHARNFPSQEDIAATFLVYLAINYRRDRIDQSLFDTVTQTVPNRLAYFGKQPFDMYPINPRRLARIRSFRQEIESDRFELVWESEATKEYAVDRSSELLRWETIPERFESQGNETRLLVNGLSYGISEPRFYRVRELKNPTSRP